MKSAIMLMALAVFSSNAFAERGPYFESASKAPITHGKVIFNSFELSSIGKGLYVGDVLIEKLSGGFEVGPMIYKCTMNDDDGAYGSLGCKYVRYDLKKGQHFNDCEVFENEYFNCY